MKQSASLSNQRNGNRMKKLFSFLRSMRFGILLLALIAALSVVGTVIPQGKEIAWYAETYSDFHGTILLLKLHDVFHTWYFQLLLALLALNLILCSVLRIRKVRQAAESEKGKAPTAGTRFSMTTEQAAYVGENLRAMRCREETMGETRVFRKNGFGRYGSFITHVSILLTLCFGALALYIPKTIDRNCMPGESLTMDDGTVIRVDSFRIEDSTGRLDFTSELEVRLPDGKESGVQEISVNHPMSFGAWKIYQQTYGTAGRIKVTNLETGGEDTITVNDLVFLSLDGVNGLWYLALYPDMIRDPSGNVTLISNMSGSYPNPVYSVQTASDGVYTPILAFPGETLQVNELQYTFEDPLEYPGLRIKHTPGIVNALLVGSFLLMIAGLYITFFCQPVVVALEETGCLVAGPKPEGMRLKVEEWMMERKETGTK